jgi:endonuclease VIII
VHVHLGLYGRFSDDRLPAEEPRGQVRMRVIGETRSTPSTPGLRRVS